MSEVIQGPDINKQVNVNNLLNEIGRLRSDFDTYFPHLDSYWENHFVPFENSDAPLPPLYHGTRVSSLTGIRLNGLVPFPEKNFKKYNAIYGDIDPHGAAFHILEKSHFDTYTDQPVIHSLNEADPPVILKIDADSYYKDVLLAKKGLANFPILRNLLSVKSLISKLSSSGDSLVERSISQMRYLQKYNLSGISSMGITISTQPIPEKYIKVLACGFLDRTNGKNVEEISLEEAYRRLLETTA